MWQKLAVYERGERKMSSSGIIRVIWGTGSGLSQGQNTLVTQYMHQDVEGWSFLAIWRTKTSQAALSMPGGLAVVINGGTSSKHFPHGVEVVQHDFTHTDEIILVII